MNADDRIILAKCFLYSLKVLFTILYAVTDKEDTKLYDDYRGLAADLRRWYSTDDASEEQAAEDDRAANDGVAR